MLGYGHKYLEGSGELILIYPKTENFDKPLAHSFNFDERQNLKLQVIPFDVSPKCQERINLALLDI
jgi:5-methylcytosine-specific restriction enzyme subunit McrC